MISVKHFLDKIKWDKRIDPKDYSIVYFDRVSGKEVEVRYNNMEVDNGFMKINDSSIPLHRVIKIKKKGKVVWERKL